MAANKRFKAMEKIDRLSFLPDAILIQILSLLPIKSAVSTSVLSHQWHYLWTHITNIVFTRTCLPFRTHDFSAAVKHILPLLTSTKIHRFYFVFPEEMERVFNIELCIRGICTRNPEEFVMEAQGYFYKKILLPACILQCQSLVELTLIGDISIKCPDEGFVVNLPKLKKLQLFADCILLAIILRCCPLLEDLNLGIKFKAEPESVKILDLSAHNLKRLVVKEQYNPAKQAKLVINVSKLEDFTLHIGRMPFLSVIGDTGALIKADICLRCPWKQDDLVGLVKLISSVKSLSLKSRTLNAVIHSLRYECAANFDKLSEVSIDDTFYSVVPFLRWCPRLKVLQLVIYWLTKVAGLLKNVIEHILKCPNKIELLSVEYRGDGTKENIISLEYDLCEKLFGLRNSSGIEIIYSGKYVKVSNKNFIPRRRSIRLAKHNII